MLLAEFQTCRPADLSLWGWDSKAGRRAPGHIGVAVWVFVFLPFLGQPLLLQSVFYPYRDDINKPMEMVSKNKTSIFKYLSRELWLLVENAREHKDVGWREGRAELAQPCRETSLVSNRDAFCSMFCLANTGRSPVTILFLALSKGPAQGLHGQCSRSYKLEQNSRCHLKTGGETHQASCTP